jgi:quinol monooxygenase YgiN
MIHSMVRMVLPARQLNEVMGILAPMVQRIRTEEGCVDCQLHKDVLEENVVILEETWASEADLERHIRSQDYRQLLLIMELAKARPEVRFDTVSRSTGFETIQKIRE